MEYCASNIRNFETFELSDEEQKEAIGYVCHERVIYYLFKKQYGINYFPIFYLDRYLGWIYSDGSEPLLPACNGLEEFLQNYVYEEECTSKERVIEEFYKIFEHGNKISIPLWMKHFSDGTPYVTAVLLEGMDINNNIYYTKHTAVDKKCCIRFSKEEFEKKLNPDENGSVHFSIIKYPRLLDKLRNMDFLEMYRYVFYNLYKYDIGKNGITKNGNEVSFDISGFDKFVDDLRKNPHKIITESGVPKHQQFRLNVHINNKIRPIQNLIKIMINDKKASELIGKYNIDQIKICSTLVDNKLNNILKFASLLVQKPDVNNYKLYINSILELKTVLSDYQRVNAEIVKHIV